MNMTNLTMLLSAIVLLYLIFIPLASWLGHPDPTHWYRPVITDDGEPDFETIVPEWQVISHSNDNEPGADVYHLAHIIPEGFDVEPYQSAYLNAIFELLHNEYDAVQDFKSDGIVVTCTTINF